MYKYTIISSPSSQCLGVRDKNGHKIVLQTVPVDEYLGDIFALAQHILDLIWRYVLCLSQLENILLSVDYLNSSFRDYLPHIPYI